MKSSSTSARKCTRCAHAYGEHVAGVTGRCVQGTCECPWFAVDPRTGR